MPEAPLSPAVPNTSAVVDPEASGSDKRRNRRLAEPAQGQSPFEAKRGQRASLPIPTVSRYERFALYATAGTTDGHGNPGNGHPG